MSTLRERVEELVAAWRKNAESFEITCGDSEVEAAYYGCADELAAALAAEGQGDAPVICKCGDHIGPGQKDGICIDCADAMQDELEVLRKLAAAPSLHKEGAGGEPPAILTRVKLYLDSWAEHPAKELGEQPTAYVHGLLRELYEAAASPAGRAEPHD